MSQEIEEAMMGLRQYMFESVYTNPVDKNRRNKSKRNVKNNYFIIT